MEASELVLVVITEPASHAGDVRDAVLILGWGRSSGEGNANPLQDSCLKNFMDSKAWWATGRGVSELDTTLRLNNNILALACGCERELERPG